MKTDEQDLIKCLSAGACTAPELQARLKLSQPSVSRLVNAAGRQVVAIGKARSRRYALRREIRGFGSDFPVFRVARNGDANRVGIFYAVAPDRYWWEPAAGPPLECRNLPWFLADMRPEGFIGRAFVQHEHDDLGLPPRLTDWREDHVLVALSRRGEDCVGDLIIGDESLIRYYRAANYPQVVVRPEQREEVYPQLAESAMEGEAPGSSAGGEQPKFGAVLHAEGEPVHVLVKFSPLMDSEEGVRWADLLVCEHHALQVIQEMGIPAAESSIHVAGQRVFLEVVRFDRVGLVGRVGVFSLGAVDDEFYGNRDSWLAAAGRLEADRRLSAKDAAMLRVLSVFGSLIANTDQHFGNVSLFTLDEGTRFSLAPAYDVLPMLYRPRTDVKAPVPDFTPLPAGALPAADWQRVINHAAIYWERAAADTRISAGFRAVCAMNAGKVLAIASGPRLLL
jgi:hypothetical protein